MPYVSILIPVYNGIEFLEECIQSIQGQTYKDWDAHIGINGHGRDGGIVAALVKDIVGDDPRFKIHIYGPEISGKTQTLNCLMFETTGEWIALLDCDDKWAPNKLQAQIEAKAGPGKNAGVVGTQCRYFGTMNGMPSIPLGPINGLEICGQVNPIINSSALIHRSLCYWNYDGLEDYALWMRLALAGIHFFNVAEPLVFHRIYPSSAFNSRKQDPTFLQKWFSHQVAEMKKIESPYKFDS